MTSDNRTIISIHQPNFFPWLGYFKKIAEADCFVFLDAVQFSKQSWTQRVKLYVSGSEDWVTCPVRYDSSEDLINQVSIDDKHDWRNNLIKTIQYNYGNSPYYDKLHDWIENLIRFKTSSLAEFNINGVKSISRKLDFDTRFVKQSDLGREGVFQASGSQRLALICEELNADVYLAGDGSLEYEEPECYDDKNVGFTTLGFEHPTYDQAKPDEFVSGLSVLDSLFNLGLDGIRDLILSAPGGLAE